MRVLLKYKLKALLWIIHFSNISLADKRQFQIAQTGRKVETFPLPISTVYCSAYEVRLIDYICDGIISLRRSKSLNSKRQSEE